MKSAKSKGTYAPHNTADDGGYIVGKNKPPVHFQFKPGDDPRRGQRQKGTRNLATDLREELEAKVSVSVGGDRKTVSRQRSVIMRLADNASRGQTKAIALILEYQQRVVEPLLQAEMTREAEQDHCDYSRLSDEELRMLEQLLSKAIGETDDAPLLEEPSPPPKSSGGESN